MYTKIKNTKMNENHQDAWNKDTLETCFGYSSVEEESELSKNLNRSSFALIALGSVDAFSSSTFSYSKKVSHIV